MSSDRPTLRMTRLAYGLLAAAFVVMFILAVERSLRLENELKDEVAEQSEAELDRILRLWEELQLDRIRGAVRDVAPDPIAAARRPPSWLDAILVWREGRDNAPGEMLYPPPAVGEDIATLLEDPCMRRAHDLATVGQDRMVIARAWQSCSDRAAPVAMLAVSRAADQYMAAWRPAEALAALEAVDVPMFPSPDLQAALSLSTARVMTRQLQYAQAKTALGDRNIAIVTLAEVGRDILGRQGPELEAVLPFLDYPVLSDLRALGAEERADALDAEAEGVRRRLAAWREVRDRVAQGASVQGEPLLRVDVASPDDPTTSVQVPVLPVVDPYGERRYLLAIARLPDGISVALEIDPSRMLSDLLRTGPGRPLRILDARGNVLLPEGAEPVSLAATVPFSRLLPELRLGMVGDATSKESIRAWRSSQLAPITIVLVMAAFAMAARIAADRQQRELWERQQAFVNRVSHELKTPLAGVKVMAELIEMGVISEPEEVVQSAQRIITETSRMENRVNAILKQARRAEVQERQLLDIAQMARDLAEEWEPRFEQKGARLLSHIDDTAPVMGDRELIRDAMNNLLDNALKYLREDVAGVVRLRTSDAGRWVVIEVTDNGLGVPEEMRRAVFDRFTRVEGDGRGMAGGHGLGLAFVAEAVRGHGGKVECREGIAGGARFIIRLRRK